MKWKNGRRIIGTTTFTLARLVGLKRYACGSRRRTRRAGRYLPCDAHSRSQSRAGCITHRIASHRIAHSPTESLNHTAIRAAILRPVRTQCVVNPRCAVWSGVAPRSRSATWGFFPPYHRTADRASSWQWRDWPWCHRNMWRFVLFVSYY